jgi:hypothetical protein
MAGSSGTTVGSGRLHARMFATLIAGVRARRTRSITSWLCAWTISPSTFHFSGWGLRWSYTHSGGSIAITQCGLRWQNSITPCSTSRP